MLTAPEWVSFFAKDLANAFFIIFSICCGFISTSLSILFTLQDRRSVKSLKSSGAFKDIISFHWRALLWCFIAILGAFGVLLAQSYSGQASPYFGYGMISVGIGAVLAVFRVIHLFVRILQLNN